ncbi:hypothetical protein Tsp_10172 [Trichinella spiralis]|uniref:Uncharacterized protein n=1 Tax=Trichinella spiralis TaxID=6334 RepID=E5SU89_TRISP|nr:hypothetical protein Tsp_10172 [Trichinella spiralis]KRY33645.1 hypothetical protein T01_8905 [Trichinella spiralis]
MTWVANSGDISWCRATLTAAHLITSTTVSRFIALQNDLFDHQVHKRDCPALRVRDRMVVLPPDTLLPDPADHLRSSCVCSRWTMSKDLLSDHSSCGAEVT